MVMTLLLYNFILFGSTTCIFISEKCPRIFDKNIMRFAAFLIITIPAALRFNVGYDYPSYVQIFEKYSAGITPSIELFWLYLLNILTSMGLPSSSFFVVSAILIYGILILSYPKKYGYIINYMYITFFYFQSFTVVRSALALSLIIYALFHLINNKRFFSFTIIIIATGFLIHKSAYLFLIIPIVCFAQKHIKLVYNKIVILILIAFLFTFGLDIINYLIHSPIASWLGYNNYAKLSVFTRPAEINSGLGILLKLSLLSLLFLIPYKHIQDERSLLYFLGLVTIGTFILSLKMFIFSRLHMLFIMGYFFVPYLLLLTTNRYRYLLILYIALSSLLLFEHAIITQNTDRCVSIRVSPYISIFNKEEDQGIPWSVCEERKWKEIYD